MTHQCYVNTTQLEKTESYVYLEQEIQRKPTAGWKVLAKHNAEIGLSLAKQLFAPGKKTTR